MEKIDISFRKKTKRWLGLLTFCLMLCMGQMGFAQVLNESFDNTGLPSGWTQEHVSGTFDWSTVTANGNSTIFPRTGTRMAEFRNTTSGTKTKLITPSLDLTSLTTPVLTFYYANVNWAGDIDELRVFYRTNASGSWVQIGDNYINEKTSWEKVELILPNPSADYYIAFEATSNWARGLNLDDVTIEEAPSCFPPTDLTAVPTHNSAVLGWTSDGDTFDISWGAGSFAAEDGTIVSFANGATLSGLASQTSYQYYVRQNCGGGDLSTWSGPLGFTTLCAPEAAPTTMQTFDTFTSSTQPPCWSEATGTLSASTTLTGTTSSWLLKSNGFANADSSNGGPSINLYGTKNEWIISNPIDLGETAGEYQLRYKYAVTSYNGTGTQTTLGTHKVRVVVSTDGGTTWSDTNVIKTYTGAGSYSNTGENEMITLNYSGLVKIAFVVTTTSSSPDIDFHIDDFIIEEVPSCFPPTTLTATNITSNSAVLAWTSDGENFDIKWGAPGFDLETEGALVEDFANGATLSGLSPQTTYQFYVRNDCGGDLSAWAGPFGFTTLCEAVSALNENFDSTTTPNLPGCWGKIVDNGASIYATITTTTTNSSSPNGVSLYNSDSSSSSNIILVSPVLSNLDAGTHWLRFSGRNSTASQDIVIGTLSDPTDGSTFTPFETVDLTTTFAEYTVDFSAYSGTDTYIGFRRLSTSTYTYVYLDDIVWEEKPSCMFPLDLTATNLTSNSADLGWTSDGENFDIKWGEPGFDVETEGTLEESFENGGTLSGLDSITAYQFYVRNNCGGGDLSVWAGPYSFSTVCETPDAPTAIVFSSVTATGTTVGYTAPTVAPTGYTIFRSTSNIPPVLANGTAYTVNSTTPVASLTTEGREYFCAAIPTTLSGTASSLTANTQYYFYVYSRNCTGNTVSYSATPLTDTMTTSSAAPTAFTSNNITFTTADVSWTAPAVGGEAGTYTYFVEVATDSGFTNQIAGSPFNAGVNAVSYNLSGLAQGTFYYVRVRTNNGFAYSPYLTGNITTLLPGQIGIGVSTQSTLPIVSNYGYNYSQQIYTKAQVEANLEEGQNFITKIKFYYNGTGSGAAPGSSTTTTSFENWTVYLGNTDKTSFGSTTDWVVVGEMQQSFSGTVTFPAPGNWMEIILDEPFQWDGDSNIVVAVDENSTSYGSSVYWRSFTSASNTGIYYRNDSTNPDPASPPTASGRVGTLAQIAFEAIETPDCLPVTSLATDNITPYTVDLSWVGTENLFDVIYGAPGFNPETEGTMVPDIAENPYTLSGLAAETAYQFYVRQHCGGSVSPWTGPINFTTEIACHPVTALTASTTLDSAVLGWTSDGTAFDIKWGTTGFNFETEGTLVEDFANGGTLSGLANSTAYQFYVRRDCTATDDGYSTWTGPFAFTTLTPNQIGAGVATVTNFPIQANWDYSYSQQIYLASEMQAVLEPGNTFITKIRFKKTSGTTPTSYNNWDIYMKNTDKETFSSTSDWVPLGELTQVFTGTLDFAANGEWTEIILTTPFLWDGTSNLAVAVHEKTVGWTSVSWASYNAGSNRGIVVYRDSTVINPATPNAGTPSSAGPTNLIAQMQIEATTIPNCLPPSALTATPASTSAVLGWESEGTTFDIKWGVSGFNFETEGTLVEGVSNNYNLSGVLTSNTNYQFYVRQNCGGGDLSDWSNAYSFTTALTCGDTFYDNGGASGNYSDNADITTSIYPQNTGEYVSVTFTSFDTENGWDGLMIYNGPDTSSPLISSGSTNNRATCPNGAWTGTATFSAQGKTFVSTHPSGALTFVFKSDGSGTRAGWAAEINCCTQGSWIWKGIVSSDWNNANNWCGAVVPDTNANVIIDSTNPVVINTNVEVASITVEDGASITVNGSLTTGDITVANGGNFVVANGASLMQAADAVNTGNIIVHKNSNPMFRLDYTLWSSPVSGQNLQAFSPATLPTRIYKYDAATDSYDNSYPENTFLSGQGYLFRSPNDWVINDGVNTAQAYSGVFTGVANNANIPVSVVSNAFNGLGNPYPSAIDAEELFAANSTIQAIYFWTNSNAPVDGSYLANNWASWTTTGGTSADGSIIEPNGEIAVGQGFIAQVNGNTSVTFNNDMRIGGAGMFFRAMQDERHRLWLNLVSNELTLNQILIGYVSGATQGEDNQIDGEMFGYGESALYSLINNSDKEFVIQGRSLPFEPTDVVPLGFRATTAGEFTVSLANFDGLFAENQNIYLKDNVTLAVHNLKEGAYSFISEEGTFDTRFEVVYQTTMSVETPDLNNNWIVFKQGDQFQILTQGFDMKAVQVFDMLGRTVYNSEAEGTTHTIARIDANQVLIVKVTTADGEVLTKKVQN